MLIGMHNYLYIFYKNTLYFENRNLQGKNIIVIITNTENDPSNLLHLKADSIYQYKSLIDNRIVNDENTFVLRINKGVFSKKGYSARLVKDDYYHIYVLKELDNQQEYYILHSSISLTTSRLVKPIIIGKSNVKHKHLWFGNDDDVKNNNEQYVYLTTSNTNIGKLYTSWSVKSQVILPTMGNYYNKNWKVISQKLIYNNKFGTVKNLPFNCMDCVPTLRFDYIPERWFQIKVQNSLGTSYKGWIQGKYTHESNSYQPEESNDIVILTLVSIPVYNNPDGGKEIGFISKGKLRAVFGRYEKAGSIWYKVRFKEKSGWIKFSKSVKNLSKDSRKLLVK
jgi:hypothetical protein